MPLVIDPAGSEIRALQKATSWRGKRVIEIGCGEGRLTLRLAELGARQIEALDPDVKSVRKARKQLSSRHNKRVTYHIGRAGRLKYPDDLFDIAIFSWAL
jgi:ubiquinone/menaquinone biosynthesis C-methylase UbiE